MDEKTLVRARQHKAYSNYSDAGTREALYSTVKKLKSNCIAELPEQAGFAQESLAGECNKHSLHNTINQSLISTLRYPALCIDEFMIIHDSNTAAQQLLQLETIIKSTNGQLSAVGTKEAAKLQAFLMHVFESRTQLTHPAELTLKRFYTGRYCECFAGCLEDAKDTTLQNTAKALIFIADPEQPVSIPVSHLKSLFGLTQCESRIAIALLNGVSLEQFSDRVHITLNTARTHLKAVFQKTETSSQANLVSLLSRLISPIELNDQDDI